MFPYTRILLFRSLKTISIPISYEYIIENHELISIGTPKNKDVSYLDIVVGEKVSNGALCRMSS